MSRKLTDLPLPQLRQELDEVARAFGPDCGTARVYRRAIAAKQREAEASFDETSRASPDEVPTRQEREASSEK